MSIVTIADPETHGLSLSQVSDADMLAHLPDNRMREKLLFNNQLMSDAVFVVEGKNVPVHSFLLRIVSPVLNVMFSQAWKQDEPIVIKDFQYPPFLSLIRWIYCEEVVVSDGQLLDVLRLASKYMVYSLIKSVTLESAKEHIWSLAAHAAEQEDAERQTELWLTIVSEAQALVQLPDFQNATPAVVQTLIAQSVLSITEIQLFEASFKWTESELRRQGLDVTDENRRTVMEPFIDLFAFKGMDPKDFAGLPRKVLTDSEMVSVFRSIHGALEKPCFRSFPREFLGICEVITPDRLTGFKPKPKIDCPLPETRVCRSWWSLSNASPRCSFSDPGSQPVFEASGSQDKSDTEKMKHRQRNRHDK